MLGQKVKYYYNKEVMLVWAMLDKILQLFKVLSGALNKGVNHMR